MRVLSASARRVGFSLVELLVVVAVIIILVALLLPAIGMARANARQRQCASNLGQILKVWAQANTRDKAQPVRGPQWTNRLASYLEGATGVFYCPDDTTRTLPSSYALQSHAWRFGGQDGNRIALLDYKKAEARVVGQTVSQLNTDWPADYAARHFQKVNVAFFDGHVESYEPDKIDPRRCDYFDRYWRPAADANIPMTGCANSTDYMAPPAGTSTTSSTTTGASTTGGTTTTSTTTTTTTGGTTTGSLPPPTLCDVKSTYNINGTPGLYNGVHWLNGNSNAGWVKNSSGQHAYILTPDGNLRACNGCVTCSTAKSPPDPSSSFGPVVAFVGVSVYNDPNLLLNACGSNTPPPFPFPPQPNGLKVTFYTYGVGVNCSGATGLEVLSNTPTATAFIEDLRSPYDGRGYYCPPSVQDTNVGAGPCGSMPGTHCASGFAAKIEGRIRPATSGVYTFYVSSDDAVKMYVNGTEVMNSFITVGNCPNGPQSGWCGSFWCTPFNFMTSSAVNMTAGVDYDLLIYHRNNYHTYHVVIEWSGPVARAPVPMGVLYPP